MAGQYLQVACNFPSSHWEQVQLCGHCAFTAPAAAMSGGDRRRILSSVFVAGSGWEALRISSSEAEQVSHRACQGRLPAGGWDGCQGRIVHPKLRSGGVLPAIQSPSCVHGMHRASSATGHPT